METMNIEQKEYITKKAALEALEEIEKEMEAEFIRNAGIVNEDGSVPSRTYGIDNDDVADQAIDDFGVLIEESGVWDKIVKAREEFRIAEENLVKYAISLVPCKKEREVLEQSASILKYRIKIIETVMKLDVTTVE